MNDLNVSSEELAISIANQVQHEVDYGLLGENPTAFQISKRSVDHLAKLLASEMTENYKLRTRIIDLEREQYDPGSFERGRD